MIINTSKENIKINHKAKWKVQIEKWLDERYEEYKNINSEFREVIMSIDLDDDF